MIRVLVSDSLLLKCVQQNDVAPDQPFSNFVLSDAEGNVLFDEWSWRNARGRTPEHPTDPAPGSTPDPAPGPDPGPPTESPATPSAPGSGGIPLVSADASTRPVLAPAAVRSFLPASGPFRFPPPWNTLGIRLTNETHGTIEPNGYGYWGKINAHAERDYLSAVVGRVGACALRLDVEKHSMEVSAVPLINLFGTGEQWYFDSHDPDILFINEPAGLFRYNVRTAEREPAIIAEPGMSLWQCHSNETGNAHSATLKALPNYNDIAALVAWSNGTRRRFDIDASFDECQIDRTGRWLLLKLGQDMLVMDTQSGEGRMITNAGHAVGHSDMGRGYVIGEDDFNEQPGAFVRWNFDNLDAGPQTVYHTTDWQEMSRDVSHCNVGQDWVLISSACRNNVPRSNELVQAWIDGSMRCRALAPSMVDLDAWMPGDDNLRTQRERDYRKLPMANVDPHGEWVFWTANCGTPRFDAFLVRVP